MVDEPPPLVAKVTETCWAFCVNVAVMAPAPLMVAVVDAEAELVNVIEPDGFALQDENE